MKNNFNFDRLIKTNEKVTSKHFKQFFNVI